MAKTAIVIKGGLAKGLGAIGLIKYLDELGRYPDLVVGSSSGAQIASMYALGLDYGQMLERITSYRLAHTSSISSLLFKGHLFADGKIQMFYKSFVPDETVRLEDLEAKTHFIATNMTTGEQEIIDNGYIIEALLASTAFLG